VVIFLPQKTQRFHKGHKGGNIIKNNNMSHIRNFVITVIVLFGTLSGGSLFAQSTWETLPVFHGGRVMPLHTFAQQTVREICGTPRPFIVRDDAIIGVFNQLIEALQQQDAPEEGGATTKFPFLTPAPEFLDGEFNRDWSAFALAGDVQAIRTELPLEGLDRFFIRELADRIRQLIPPEGRVISADEILFAWICEPEVWRYIPIFPVPDAEFLEEMFNVSFVGDVRTSQHRVSLHQLENSPRYRQRLTELMRRHEIAQATGQIPKELSRNDLMIERLEQQSRLFKELTFHPQRQRPTRMLSLLYEAAGFADERSSFLFAFRAWGHLLERGDVPGRRAIMRLPEASSLPIFHPSTRRWHDIQDKLHHIIRLYDRTDSSANPVLPNAINVEQQYELLIDLLDITLAEAAALMETLHPGISYRPAGNDHEVRVDRLLPLLGSVENQQYQAEIRQNVLRYYFTVKKLRKEVEAAYLALYDNGHSLRFLPVRSPVAMELGSSQNNFGVQPWASAQMILGSGEAFVRRFFDPQIQAFVLRQVPSGETTDSTDSATPNEAGDIDPDVFFDWLTSETKEPEESNEPVTVTDTTHDALLDPDTLSPIEQSFPSTGARNWLFLTRLDERSVIGSVRLSFQMLYASLTAPGRGYAGSDFNFRMSEFQEAVRSAAVRVETHRSLLVDDENQRMVEQFAKTAYPGPESGMSKIRAEYNYSRLDPFYWMWVFALIAVILNGGAYAVSLVQRERESATRSFSIHATAGEGNDDEKTELQDYTNTLEEWLFIGSVAMLTLSMLTAFVGALIRSSITGWAPVTNMYETIVMMAFAAAIIGVCYTLLPLLHPALKLAWVYSKFPRIGALMELLAALKAHKSATPQETPGETAMREAAEEFGVPGGVALGHHPAYIQNQGREVFDTLRRVKAAQRKITWQCLLTVPRLILTFAVFYVIVLSANEGKFVAEQGFWVAATEMFETSDVVDWLAVVVSVVLLVWIVPHLLLTLLLIPVVLFRTPWIATEQGIRSFESKIFVEQVLRQKGSAVGQHRSEMSKVFHGDGKDALLAHDTSGAAWLKQARNAVLDRKLFIAITAAVVCLAGLAASLNRVEFNPDFRPIPAVLRSNYWLTVHVTAFFVGYAAVAIAWGMAVVSLGFVIFGRYQRTEPAFEGQKTRILLPNTCQLFSPAIEMLIRIALLLLIAGTVLGGRWADYSWGRFWSWDPKEVWALITIIFLVIVFHGRIARYYGTIGITVGALFASIAVFVTWYGVNFVFKSGLHAYGGGTESVATYGLSAFIVANVLWGTLGLLRYGAEVYGNEADD